MNVTKGQFRWLVTASVAVTILGVVASFATESLLPAPLRDYLASQADPDLTVPDWLLFVVGIPLLVALLVSIVGLYRFWPFARPLTVIVWIVGLIFQAFLGPTVDSGLATSLYELAAVLNGIIIAVIYITPAKIWFEKTHDS